MPIRSVIGSITVPPYTPECKSCLGPSTCKHIRGNLYHETRGRHVVIPCFYDSPEHTNQTHRSSRFNLVTVGAICNLATRRHKILHTCTFSVAFLKHNLSKEVAVSSGAVGEGGSSAKPAAVWDDNVIHIWEETVFLGQDHGVQAVGPSLLHAFDDKLHIHWQLLVDKKVKEYDSVRCVWLWVVWRWLVLEKNLVKNRLFLDDKRAFLKCYWHFNSLCIL